MSPKTTQEVGGEQATADFDGCVTQTKESVSTNDTTALGKAMKVQGHYHGQSFQFYTFSYNGIDEKWLEGKVSPIHENDNYHELKGSFVSIWTVEMKKESELRELTCLLHQLSDDALMQPLFCVENNQIKKFIMACSPGTSEFNKWISKQASIPSDGYVSVQGKSMIRSIILLGDTLWKKGLVCTGLDNPKTYRMLDSKVKVIPFAVRKRLQNDDPMIHRLSFATLLEKEIYPKWKEPDLKEFIKLMKNPTASLENLLEHPLLLEPEKRLALYQALLPPVLTPNQIKLLQSLEGLADWRKKVGSVNELHGVLTYSKFGSGQNPTYGETQDEAVRFACNASSHYMKYWKESTHISLRKIPSDHADKSLKKVLPGLLSQVYGLIFHSDWRSC